MKNRAAKHNQRNEPAIVPFRRLSPTCSLVRRSIFHVSSTDYEEQKEPARSLSNMVLNSPFHGS